MTLRQEIEKLRDDLQKDETLIGDHLAISLTDILSRHSEPEPTAPSQRERIATACMQGITSNPNFKASTKTCAEAAVTAADALIEELNKNAGHVRP